MNLGIISRSGRSYPDSAGYDFIQTDAGAYPGVSGGPLLNSKGDVVGMITMASERGNMGFATPINVIKQILPRLVKGEKFAWGWLGVPDVGYLAGTGKDARTSSRERRRGQFGVAGTARRARRHSKAGRDFLGQRNPSR